MPLRRIALPRGVYRSRRKQLGRWAYIAVAGDGRVLECYSPRRTEWDADIVSALGILLKIADPPRGLLKLVTVRPLSAFSDQQAFAHAPLRLA